MSAIISDIFLFSYDKERRHLSFKEGLNIITGDSKTGKSAIIEIVDFCLFSKRPTIPVGKITDWTEIFSVVYSIGAKKIIVARSIDSVNKCYFSTESDFDAEENLTIDYLHKLTQKSREDAQVEFEQHLGLSVVSTKEHESQTPQSSSKVSIRDAATFMFQHQNLVANKHSIFYRFDNYYKREKTISDFPIHLGWADSHYFFLKREHDLLEKKIKKEKRRLVTLKSAKENKRLRLIKPIEEYYLALGMVLEEEDKSLNKLIKISRNLPEIPKSIHENSNLAKQLEDLIKKRRAASKELREIKAMITLVGDNTDDANSYAQSMYEIVQLSKVRTEPSSPIECPLCNSDVSIVNDLVEEVKSSRMELITELSKLGTFKQDNSETLNQLAERRDTLKEEVKSFRAPIDYIQKTLGISKDESLKEALYTLRGTIKAHLQQILDDEDTFEGEVTPGEPEERLKEINDEIAGYNLRGKVEEANEFINKTMDDLLEKLDFEEELRPGKMMFDLAKFDFSYRYKSKNISLSEMGSGANWLACHLSLFLALLKLIVREKSSLPAVLFFDQPSQVYFPKISRTFSSSKNEELLSNLDGDDTPEDIDENIKQVVNIFTVIDSFLDDLVEDESIQFKPQIIVLEHADEPELDKFVRKRWSAEGEKLI